MIFVEGFFEVFVVGFLLLLLGFWIYGLLLGFLCWIYVDETVVIFMLWMVVMIFIMDLLV